MSNEGKSPTGPGWLKSRLLFWVGASRAPFFIAVITPTLLGTAIAWSAQGVFHWEYFLLALVGVVLINGGTNLVNDYFDHKSSNDEVNTEYTAPFSGGSRMIQKGLLTPSEVMRAGILFFAAAIAIGIYLTWARGSVILILGLVGILSGFFYTAPPFKLGYRWVGEFVVGLNCGILVTLGAYFVQTQQLAWLPVVAALPLGLLIAAVLWINEIPDYTADRAVGKMQMVARLGRPRAATGYVLLLAAAYIVLVLGVLGGWFSPEVGTPPLALLGLLALPLAIRLMTIARKHYSDLTSLVPANASTPMLYLATGLLISLGFVIDKLVAG